MNPVYCDTHGNVFDLPGHVPAFRTGNRVVPVQDEELIPLPYGSLLFSMPGRYPVFYDGITGEPEIIDEVDHEQVWAASAFLSSGYLRTYLPASRLQEGSPSLPLWAYSGVVYEDGQFMVPALRIDEDPRSDPEIHENEKELKKAAGQLRKMYPENRLVRQLQHCATEYRCLCARNFFLSRYEAPVPTTPSCNARCAGCLSFQEEDGVHASQYRLKMAPTPEEIAEVMLHHARLVDESVLSFGQGCEGEPLLRAKDLSAAIEMVREKTDRGTIHLNTNGSLPGELDRMIRAGLQSVRISLNSPNEKYYNAYYRPQGYSYGDVLQSIRLSIDSGLFVSLNLFFMPGFTDMESEVDALFTLLDSYPVHMIQTRNLNIDPDYYFDAIGFVEDTPLGIRTMLDMIKKEYPGITPGYYNPPREQFRK